MLPLAAITGANFNKLHPQARSYFEDIATKLGILVGNSVKSDKIEVWAGSYSSFFKSYTKDYMLTKMTWDGKEGFFLPILSTFLLSAHDRINQYRFSSKYPEHA